MADDFNKMDIGKRTATLIMIFTMLRNSQQLDVLEIVSDLRRFNEKRQELYSKAMAGPDLVPLYPEDGAS